MEKPRRKGVGKMTRKEAISWLFELKESEGEDVPIYEEDVEALNMAITSLEVDEAYGLGYENVGVVERSSIDKAIAEIKDRQQKFNAFGYNSDDVKHGMKIALDIIDKYIGG